MSASLFRQSWAGLLAAGLLSAHADTVVPLGGSGAVTGQVTAIDAAGQVCVGDTTWPLQQVWRIERGPVPAVPTNAPAVVHLVDDSRLVASAVTLDKDTCRVRWAAGAELAVPLTAVRALRFAAPAPADFAAALQAPAGQKDRLHMLVEGKPQMLDGALERMDAETLTFVWNDAPQKIARAKVLGVVLAALAAAPDRTGWAAVRLADGSVLWSPAPVLANGVLSLKLAGQIACTVPWEQVRQLDVRSDRLRFLSDLDPVQVVEEALVAFAGPWRRDASVLGGPLRIGDQTFERGLGTHARCRLTFAVPAGFTHLAATIGIDRATEGRGDCVFQVLGDDGRELFSRRMKGADAPLPVRVAVAGMKQVTLAVEPGEDLDLGDHGDWGAARFEKESGGK